MLAPANVSCAGVLPSAAIVQIWGAPLLTETNANVVPFGGGKFVAAYVKDDPACDAKLKEFKATVRCIPLVDEYGGPGNCIITGERVAQRVIVAKAY